MNWRCLSHRLSIPVLCMFLLTACDRTAAPEKTTSLAEIGLFSANLSKHYGLIGDLSGHAELWQLQPKSLVHKWQHTDDSAGVIAVDISSKEDYAITAEKNSIAWWRVEDGSLLSVWSLPDIFSVSISADGRYALVGLADKAIYLSLEHGKTLYAFEHNDPVISTDLSASGRYALTGSEDHSAKLWDLSDGRLKYNWKHDNKLSIVALSPGDRYALTNAALSQTRLWKIDSGKIHKELGPPRVTLSAATFSDDEQYLLTGHISQRIELWKTANGRLVEFWRAKKTDRWRPTAATIVALGFEDQDKTFNSIATNGYLQRWKTR